MGRCRFCTLCLRENNIWPKTKTIWTMHWMRTWIARNNSTDLLYLLHTHARTHAESRKMNFLSIDLPARKYIFSSAVVCSFYASFFLSDNAISCFLFSAGINYVFLFFSCSMKTIRIISRNKEIDLTPSSRLFRLLTYRWQQNFCIVDFISLGYLHISLH